MNDRAADVDNTSDGFRPTVRQVVAVLLVVAVVAFVAQNTETRSVNFLVWDVQGPLWMVLSIVAFVGFLAGWLFGRRRRD